MVEFLLRIFYGTGFDDMAEQSFLLSFHQYVYRLGIRGNIMGNFESCAPSHVVAMNWLTVRKFTDLT